MDLIMLEKLEELINGQYMYNKYYGLESSWKGQITILSVYSTCIVWRNRAFTWPIYGLRDWPRRKMPLPYTLIF